MSKDVLEVKTGHINGVTSPARIPNIVVRRDGLCASRWGTSVEGKSREHGLLR